MISLKRIWRNNQILIGLIGSWLIAADAMQNRMTAMPTPWPTTSPSISIAPSKIPTNQPSDVPSMFPSRFPSAAPTLRPTMSERPSNFPSEIPSSLPTRFPTTFPTLGPTQSKAPTLLPSAQPAGKPTVSPTTVPTPKPKPVDVPLPKLRIDFSLTDSDANSKAFYKLETDLTIFLETVLSTRVSGNFAYVNVTVEYSQFVSTRRRLEASRSRRLQTRVTTLMNGTAHFLGGFGAEAPPTEDELAQVLVAYFSFWGIQDLESQLQLDGLQSASNVNVAVNGTQVQVVTSQGNGNQTLNSTATAGSNKSNITMPAIIGLAVGAFVLLVAVALVLIYSKTKRRQTLHEGTTYTPPRRSQHKTRHSSANKKNPLKGGRLGVKQPSTSSKASTPTPYHPEPDEVDDGHVSLDGISVDNSLYTTDESYINAASKPKKSALDTSYDSTDYDPHRLDRVIAAAKASSSDK